MDESGMRNQYVGKNISELRHSIDSIGARVDSIGAVYADEIKSQPYLGLSREVRVRNDSGRYVTVPRAEVAMSAALDLDSIFNAPTPSYAKTYLNQALMKARRQRQDYEYRSLSLTEQAKLVRRHDIEMQKKFTLSIACIIFFFIGAPLGAIIKKGGLGTPLVISIILFIIYYIIDNTGYKMARDGKILVWEGLWLSTAVLLPLGVFFTYKAVGDSAVFNIDAYRNFFNRLIGRQPKRNLELKEVIMTETERGRSLEILDKLLADAEAARAVVSSRPRLMQYFITAPYRPLRDEINNLVDYLSNTRDPQVVNLINKYPFAVTRRNLDAVIATTRELTAYIGGSDGSEDKTEDNGTEN